MQAFITATTYAMVNIKTGALAYVIQPTARDCWREVEERDLLGSHSREFLRKQGWRAKEVFVHEMGP